jgi:hypothetical protein
MKRTLIITGIVICFTIIALTLFNKLTSKKDSDNLFAEAEMGDFEIAISAAGELLAENSTDIKAPEIAQGRDFHARKSKLPISLEGTEAGQTTIS